MPAYLLQNQEKPNTKQALDDLVLLDFFRSLAGPYPAYLLGQMGAYVIKVERPYRNSTIPWCSYYTLAVYISIED